MTKSDYIRNGTALNILKAFDYANYIGKPFNYVITLHLEDAIYQCSNTAFQRVMQKFRVWLVNACKRQGIECKPMYCFVHEDPDNKDRGDGLLMNINPHVHMAVYIPEELRSEFEAKLTVWIEKVQGPLGEKTLLFESMQMYSYKTWALYMLKGLDPEYLNRYSIPRRFQAKGPQGTIWGQRAGFSRALGPKAQERAGFVAKEHRLPPVRGREDAETKQNNTSANDEGDEQ